MLKTRIISAAVGSSLLIAVILLGRTAVGIAIFLVALVSLYEFYHSLKSAGYKPIEYIGYASCLMLLPVVFSGKTADYGKLFAAMGLFYFLLTVAVFMHAVFRHDRYTLSDLSLTLFGIMYIPFLLSFFILTRNMEFGSYYMWIIFIGAWATDTFAYFTGISMGRRRFLPQVSSKKTVEGSIGGLVGCIAAMTVYGLFVAGKVGNIPLYHFAALGALCGIVSQLGDWAASAIKRYAGVKDYGKIMPGHGGLLDRFDSILFIAPTVYFYVSLVLG